MAEKQRVMIVDDDANIAELISLYLAKECYETKIVYDGEEALKVFPEFRPQYHPVRSDASRHGRLPGLPGAAYYLPGADHHAFR